MANWSLYAAKMAVGGETLRDKELNAIGDYIADNFKDTPSYRLANDKDIQVIETMYPNVKQIIAGEINVGDVLEFDGYQWLCFEVNKTNPLYEMGKVYMCVGTLRVGATEIPYVVYDNIALTRMGVDINRGFLITPNSRMMIAVSNNSTTKHIRRNDTFLLYNNDNVRDTYRVLDINRVRNSGLIVIELDYHVDGGEEPENPISTPDTGYEIVGDGEIKMGQVKNYIAKKYDDEEEVSATFTFSVIADGVPQSAYDLTVVSDNECKIECNDYYYDIVLRATDTEGGGYAEKEIALKSFL